MKKTLQGILFNGQPVYEEWSEDRRMLTWSSRTVSGDYPKDWKVTGYPVITSLKLDNRTRPDTRMVRIQEARARLATMPGMMVDKAVLARLRAQEGHPQQGQQKRDEHGVIRCMAYVDGYLMVRRPGCMPWVMAEDKWHTLSA